MPIHDRQNFELLCIYFCRDLIKLSYKRWKHLVATVGSELSGIHEIKGYDIWYPGSLDPVKVSYRPRLCISALHPYHLAKKCSK